MPRFIAYGCVLVFKCFLQIDIDNGIYVHAESVAAVDLFGKGKVIPYNNSLAVDDYSRCREFIQRVPFVRLSCDSISVTKRWMFFCDAAKSVRNAIAARQVMHSRVQKRNSFTS